jgi:hypothetical protein
MARFAERTIWNICPRARLALVHLDLGYPDHLGPLLGFVGDQLSEVRRRARGASSDCLHRKLPEQSPNILHPIELPQRLQDGVCPLPTCHFVTSMTAPVASGWSGCRVGFAPTGKRRLSTAHTQSGLWQVICRAKNIDRGDLAAAVDRRIVNHHFMLQRS